MNQDPNLDSEDEARFRPAGPKPIAQRPCALLRQEARHRESLLPPAPPQAAAATQDNSGGIRHPLTRRMIDLRLALVQAVTAEDIAGLTRVLVAKAEAGDVAAVKLLFSYLLHQPAAAPDPERRPRVDSRQLQEWVSQFANDAEACQRLAPLALAVARGQAGVGR